MVLRLTLLLVLTTQLMLGCSDSDRDKRAEQAGTGEGDVVVGLVWDDSAFFRQGAQLALEEINAAGGVLGRPLRLMVRTEPQTNEDPAWTARKLADSLCSHSEVVAVIGHNGAETAVPASITYETQGVLYINPTVTDRALNDHGFQYVFTIIPDSEMIAKQVAAFAFGLGYRRVGVLSGRDPQAEQVTKAFLKHAVSLGLTVVVRRSFFGRQENFRDIIADFGALPFDAVFLATSQQAAERIVSQSIEMNMPSPFVMGRFMNDIQRFREVVGPNAPHIAIPALFNPYSTRPEIKRFNAHFQTKYSRPADGWAAQGYDAINLLVYAMEQARSSVPLTIATIMRYTLSWSGLTGRYSFDRQGSVYTKALEFVILNKGRLEYHSPDGSVSEAPALDDKDEPS